MSSTKEIIVVWTCDRCKISVKSKDMPATCSDPWAIIKWNQPTGFESNSINWSTDNSVYEVCGNCAAKIKEFITNYES